MRTRWRQRATTVWIVVFVLAAIFVAVFARVVVFHKTKTPPASANASLRLDPGTLRFTRHPVLRAGANATAIAAGDYSSCAVVGDASPTVYCWGDGAHGQLGDGTRDSSLTPVAVLGLPGTPKTVAVGGSQACALLTDGRVACWGSNGLGRDVLRPTIVHGVTGVSAIAVGVADVCAVVAGGSVECWGANSNGQLGNGTTTSSSTPLKVNGLDSVRSLAVGLAHTCALLRDGAVECWGANTNGELGDRKTIDSPAPVSVVRLGGGTSAIAAGDAHTCALLTSGSVDCWGWNIQGQLGNGGGNDSSTPVAVSGIHTVKAISAGGNDTCALLKSGAVDCWGGNANGELGNGSTVDSSSPLTVTGLGNSVAAIATGSDHSCALLEGGSTTCWGANAQGQLGDGTTTSSSTPVGVAGLGLATDGSGTLAVSPASLPSGTKRTTITFTFTVAPGGMHDGTLTIDVPPGWSVPSTTANAPGFSAAGAGSLRADGRTITVSGLTLTGGQAFGILYGSTHGGGPGAVVPNSGQATWETREQSSIGGGLGLVKQQPTVAVLSPDGSGTLTSATKVVANKARARTIHFVYTAAAGGLAGGTVTLDVPKGWSRPTKLATTPGFTAASRGTLSITGQTITVSDLKLGDGGTMTIAYRGDAPAANVGSQSWTAEEQSGHEGKLRSLGSSPLITVLSADGSGQVDVGATTVPNGALHVSLTFTYVAYAGGVRGGAIRLTVPPGWSVPSTQPNSSGSVVASAGKPSIKGRMITVPVKDLESGSSISITYGGATAPAGDVASQTWVVQERSSRSGSMKRLAHSPDVTVLAPDGSGSLYRATGDATPGSPGNTVVFVFEAAAGGVSGGRLELTVPAGWSAPSTQASDPGYVTASPGAIAVHGQVIELSGLTLKSGDTVTIVYGSRAGGGPGATAAGGAAGPHFWRAREQSSSGGGALTRLHGT